MDTLTRHLLIGRSKSSNLPTLHLLCQWNVNSIPVGKKNYIVPVFIKQYMHVNRHKNFSALKALSI